MQVVLLSLLTVAIVFAIILAGSFGTAYLASFIPDERFVRLTTMLGQDVSVAFGIGLIIVLAHVYQRFQLI